MRHATHAVHLDHQSLPWLRVCMQVLLRTLHARVHGNARWPGIRAQNLREAKCRMAAAPGFEKSKAGAKPGDRNCDGSLSTCRTALRDDSLDPGGPFAALRVRH